MFDIRERFSIECRGPRGGDMAVHEMIRDGRRNLRHVESLRTSKRHGGKIREMSDSQLVSAMKWLGQATVCRVVKEAKNARDVTDLLGKEYAKVA